MDIQLSYKEYKAVKPNVLLNIDTFIYCSYSMCNMATSINYIEVTQEGGEYFSNKYENMLKNLNPEDAQAIAELKRQMLEELTLKGYNITDLVQPIIHD